MTPPSRSRRWICPPDHCAVVGCGGSGGIRLDERWGRWTFAKDRVAWQRAKTLHEAALLALKAIDERNPQGITDAGEQIEHARENCHLQYWYPSQVLPPGYDEPAPRTR